MGNLTKTAKNFFWFRPNFLLTVHRWGGSPPLECDTNFHVNTSAHASAWIFLFFDGANMHFRGYFQVRFGQGWNILPQLHFILIGPKVSFDCSWAWWLGDPPTSTRRHLFTRQRDFFGFGGYKILILEAICRWGYVRPGLEYLTKKQNFLRIEAKFSPDCSWLGRSPPIGGGSHFSPGELWPLTTKACGNFAEYSLMNFH